MSVRKPECSPLLPRLIHLSSTRSELYWQKGLPTPRQATKSKSSLRIANRIPTGLRTISPIQSRKYNAAHGFRIRELEKHVLKCRIYIVAVLNAQIKFMRQKN